MPDTLDRLAYSSKVFMSSLTSTNRISEEDKLRPGQEITSSNGNYVLIFQHDSNLVLYHRSNNGSSRALWASDTWDPNGSSDGKYLVLQEDGNFMMYNKNKQPLWSSGSWQYGAKKPFIMVQDDGNVCLYDEKVGGCHWTTDTYQG